MIDVSEVLTDLLMEAVSTSETSANIYQSTRRNNPEDTVSSYIMIYVHFFQPETVNEIILELSLL
jgi:hypothetical protein